MRNFMYYGEMVAKISASLHDQMSVVNKLEGANQGYRFWTLCADAAKVFKQVEDLCDELEVNWPKAVEDYANKLSAELHAGRNLSIIDLYYLCARSIEANFFHPE